MNTEADRVQVITADDTAHAGLLRQYLNRRIEQSTRLSEHLSAGRYDEIESAGHNLYGTGSAYGLPRITEIGQRLEQAAIRRDRTTILHIIVELRTFASRVVVRVED